MCDLIDLNSPNVKGLLDAAKLASPLIPVPKTTEANGGGANPLVTEKYESVDSNPFDKMLHETTEYISKKGDPFEMMLQRALKFKGRKNTALRTQSIDFMDDFTPKRKKKYLKTLNKTLDALDESLLGDKLDLSCKKLMMEENVNVNAKKTDVVCNNNVMENAPILKENHKITDPNSLELSILNQSAMNDTLDLLKSVSETKGNDETSHFIENDMVFKELIPSPNVNIKSIELRRALSQGDRRSPIKLPCLNRRTQSATDDQRRVLQSETSTISYLDRGFRESKQSEQSVFSSLSNVSSVMKLNSTSISSLILSNDTMNDAFLNSDLLKNQENAIEDSLKLKYNLSDLTEKLNKLKCDMNRTNSISSITDDSNSPKENNNKQITKDKLIDVDVFILEQNSNKEHNKSSISTSSLDSVFTETSKRDKSILNEAKALARTLEELETDFGSSADDDLISNNTLWMPELLPAFEDDVVDNLIELPVSPEGSSKGTIKDDKKHIPTNMENAKENSLNEIIASQFTDSIPTISQTIVTSLLSDLKKLVKTENNTEVNKLLDNLEIALGANCKNNTELLITCFNISNELQSPRKSITSESSEKTSIDRGKDESGKVSSEEEICNSEKSLSDITHKLENSQAAADTTDNDVSAQTSLCKDNSKNLNDTNALKVALNTSYTEEQNNQLDEKLAVELLINLGKLLRGQAEDAVTMQLLKNIGKALNIASNTCKFENEQQTDYDKKRNAQQIIPAKTVRSDSIAYLANATHRRSLNLKSKTLEKTSRRSVSVIDSPTTNMPNTQRRYKGISEMENRKKHFSNDPEFINLANKKVAIPEAAKKKEETTGSDINKEKSIAIGDVKNRLKKRSNVINKKGPIKAVHPASNMQKRASFGKQAARSSDTITPPKPDKVTSSGSKIISSTPNSVDGNYFMPKKPTRSKPMASSTPDGQNGKISNAQLTSANKNFSCDISPVTMYANTNDNNERKGSPKRPSKLPTPKKSTTPKRQATDTFRISRYSTPPKHNSSFNVNHQQPLLESPQRLNTSVAVCQRYSPAYQRKNDEKIQKSPLKENRVIAKVKPLKLISKLRRHSNSDFTEKENNCA